MMAEAREAMRRYGQDADVRVITFYNMQRRDLEREINNHLDLANVRITSVRNLSRYRCVDLLSRA